MVLLLVLILLSLPSDLKSQTAVSAPSPLAKARALIERGQLQEAETDLWTVLSANPADEQALLLLGMVRQQQERGAEAEALFRRVLEINPKSARAEESLAALLAGENKVEEAIQHYEKAAGLSPLTAAAAVTLGRLYVKSGKFGAALSTLDALPQSRRLAAATPVQAAALIGLGRNQEAASLIPRARSPETAVELAEVFLQNKLPRQAWQCLEQASAPGSQTAHYFSVKARVLQANGDLPAALATVRQGIEKNPRSVELLLNLAEIHALAGRHPQSVKALLRARSINSHDPEILRHLIVEALAVRQHALALEAATELARSSSSLDDQYLAAAAIVQEREFETAARILEPYVRQHPSDARGYLALALAYLGQQRFSDGKEKLEQALQLNPSLAEAEYQLGELANKDGSSSDAIRHLEKAAQLQPGHAKAQLSLGTLYLQSGDLEKARSALEKAQAADTTDPGPEYQLSLLYTRLGQSGLAQQHLQRFRELKEKRDRSLRGGN
jgi:tetratricopeptide (TPR) repeat protein